MSSENRGNIPAQPPVYVVYPGHQQNVNYGFHPEPPPKYEYVVNGIPPEQSQPSQTIPQTAGVVFVAPVRPYNSPAKVTQYICTFLVIMIFLSFSLSIIFKGK